MRGFRLFERPLSVLSSQPQLYIQGSLPDYTPGAEYEGRLQYVNSVGRCHVEIVEEDSHLPDGATAIVDNFSKEIVLRWPAFSPPEEEKEGIVNWNFELGDLTGWKDLRGNSWDTYVYDITTEGVKDNPYLPAPGNIAARMTGAGRGDHILESDLYPVTPGAPISARSLWYQGPSNKDNNNLWTAIQFYSPGKVPLVNGEVRGDRIHDRTNKARHWSSVNTTVPAAAGWASVKLIAYRRNGRNRLINVDDVETSGFHYTVGVEVEEDYYVKLKLTDSANQVAYWEGPLFWSSNVYTSLLYPLVVRDDLESHVALSGLGGIGSYTDLFSSGSVLSDAVMQDEVRYLEAEVSTDIIASAGRLLSVSMQSTVTYTSFSGLDSMSAAGRLNGATMEVVVSYVSTAHPTDSFQANSKLTQASMT